MQDQDIITHSDQHSMSGLELILRGPEHPKNYFDLSGHTYEEIYEMAW